MSRRTLTITVAAVCFLALLTAGGIITSAPRGGNAGPAFVPGELIVRFQPNANALDHASAKAQLNAVSVKKFRSGAEH